MVHYRSGRAALNPDVYADIEPFWADLAAAYADADRRRWPRWAAPTCSSTTPAWPTSTIPAQREAIASSAARTPRTCTRPTCRNINNALAGRPEGLTVTTHLCRGNFRSSWAAEGGYDYVAETLFGGLDVDGFFLEYDDARSGGFEPLRFVPPGKMVVLGLVTTKRAAAGEQGRAACAESRRRRATCRSSSCASRRSAASPPRVEGNALTYDDQVAKLELVVETAAAVWGS